MTLSPSKHNLLGPLGDTGSWYLVNPLSGSADVLTEEEARAFRAGSPIDPDLLAERGYLTDQVEEESRFRRAYLDFLDGRDRDEVQLFFVPWYGCNFACDYCYQSAYEPEPLVPSSELIDAFFAYVDQQLGDRRRYLTVFGGEPLLPGARQRRVIEQLVDGAVKHRLPLAVVTNGYHLESYLDLLARAEIRELQVTLDGVGPAHDRRRPLKGGGSTFERVVAGIDAALARDLPVNLRFVVDRDNLAALPDLADFAIARGWTEHPRFKTQIGRNYELHECQSGRAKLYSRLELYQDLLGLIEQHPQLLELHRPAFHFARFLFDQGELPSPIFDACPACKTEWAFDASGRIFPCTANVGKEGEDVGTFFPEITLDEARVAEWEDRDVLAIDACRSCSVQLVCGAGCGAVAKNQSGRIASPDCRPAPELVQLGMSLYFGQTPEPHKERCSCPTK